MITEIKYYADPQGRQNKWWEINVKNEATMKRFEVDVDITMSKRISVEAEDEEHAKAIVNGWMKYNPYEYAHSFDAYLEHEITDVNEEEPEEKSELDKAIEYIRENMDECDLDFLKAQMRRCYESHLIPDRGVMDCDKVVDLLEEFGEENDLPECWWESECDFDEILAKI